MLLLIPIAIGVQMVRLNWSAGEGLRALWQNQAIELHEIPAKRGNIYDRKGRLLATNSVSYKIALDPSFTDFDMALADTVSHLLSKAGLKNKDAYLNRIKNARKNASRYVVLEQRIPHSVYMDLKALNRRSVILEKSFNRVYGFNDLAAHVLGFVNFNADGMIGLEAAFNRKLKGQSGLQQVRKDRHNKVFEYVGAPIQEPIDGSDVYTTLDIDIQSIAETELRLGIQKNLAKSGVVIVMDVESGAVRAMASWPTFNPNKPASKSEENRRNFAISDMIEPGSTFKLVTAVAALDQDVIRNGEIFETPEDGRKIIHGLAMVDHDPLGSLTFEQVIAKSSNIATSEIASRIPKSAFYQYARNLGFGTPTNIELPSESEGLLKKPMVWTEVTQPFMSIGYEVLATPLQITQAYAAFANKGILMKPFIVERIVDKDGDVEEVHKPIKVRRAIDEHIVEKLMPIFEQVVSDSGTAAYARVSGMRVAGKTGTAKMVKEGRYTTAYRASFVGYFPAEAPKYVCYVLLEEPGRSIYGGYTAGPIFKNIAQRLAAHEGFNDGWVDTKTLWASNRKIPMPLLNGLQKQELEVISDQLELDIDTHGQDAGFVLASATLEADSLAKGDEVQIALQLPKVKDGLVEVPDVRGMSMRTASRVLRAANLDVKMIRSGTVYKQFPLAGEKMREGRTVVLSGRAKSLSELAERGKQP